MDTDITMPDFKHFGEYKAYKSTKASETFERIKNATIVLTNKATLSAKDMDAAPNLKFICSVATGCNQIDIPIAWANYKSRIRLMDIVYSNIKVS